MKSLSMFPLPSLPSSSSPFGLLSPLLTVTATCTVSCWFTTFWALVHKPSSDTDLQHCAEHGSLPACLGFLLFSLQTHVADSCSACDLQSTPHLFLTVTFSPVAPIPEFVWFLTPVWVQQPAFVPPGCALFPGPDLCLSRPKPPPPAYLHFLPEQSRTRFGLLEDPTGCIHSATTPDTHTTEMIPNQFSPSFTAALHRARFPEHTEIQHQTTWHYIFAWLSCCGNIN